MGNQTRGNKFIVIHGEPTSGFTIIGPFETFEDAENWANEVRESYWITELIHPDS